MSTAAPIARVLFSALCREFLRTNIENMWSKLIKHIHSFKQEPSLTCSFDLGGRGRKRLFFYSRNRGQGLTFR